MSSAINTNRKAYYKALEHTTGYIQKMIIFLILLFGVNGFTNFVKLYLKQKQN